MKRFVQAVTLAQLILLVGLGVRFVNILGVTPPTFEDPSQVATREVIPPRPQRKSPGNAATSAIVGGNLFDSERGRVIPEDPIVEEVLPDEPLPPPDTVRLNGILLTGPSPVAIMTDTALGPTQRRVQSGDFLGEYEVGEIRDRSVMLLGPAGEEFLVGMTLNLGTKVAARPVASRGAARAAPPPRAGTSRATPARGTTRTPPQRPAPPARSSGNQRGAHSARNESHAKSPARPDPVQARLEALRRLREAASNRTTTPPAANARTPSAATRAAASRAAASRAAAARAATREQFEDRYRTSRD